MPPILRVADFIAAEGVNTHIPYTDGAYRNVQTIISDLAYLGVTHVRDSLNTPGQFGGAPFDSFVTVAKAGIKFDFTVGGGGNILASGGQPTSPSLDQRVSYIAALASKVPGSVSAVEGTNEINNQPISYKGLGSTGQGNDELQAALSMQTDLYSLVHNSPALAGTPVYYFTGNGSGSIPLGPDPATVAGLADYDNRHPYPNYGQAPGYWVSRTQALKNATSLPAVYTETGYSSAVGAQGAVSGDVQAKYTVDLLLDDAKAGISSTYLYELLDAYAPGSPQGDAGYGLFDHDGTAKPVAVAIHNLNSILSDPGSTKSSFTPTTLAYTVSGSTTTSSDMQMARSDGSHIIAVWDEQSIWDPATGSKAATTHSETITLGSNSDLFDVSIYDPIQSSQAVATKSLINKITLDVNDHPLLLVVTPVASAPAVKHLAPSEPHHLMRFFDRHNGTQFFTNEPSEAGKLSAADFTSEPRTFSSAPASDPNTIPIFRLFDTKSGSHFYTASADEISHLMTDRTLLAEPIGFNEYSTKTPGTVPVYRFFEASNGSHFYTADSSEYKSILQNRPNMISEGIAFYAPP